MRLKLSKKEKRIVKKRLKEYKRRIKKEQIDIITEKISEEENSIHIVNTCFQPFESSNKSQFVFYRTDPLYLSQVVNFDIALCSANFNTICLVECKSSLGKGLVSEVKKLQEKIDFIEKNNIVNIDGKKIRIKEYFAKNRGLKKPNFYYVLASEIVGLRTPSKKNSIYNSIVKESEYPFDIWLCTWVFKGIKITRNPIPSKYDKEKRISIQDLTDYLNKTHSSAGNTIQICLSSNKYYIAVQSCINLKNFESFKFNNFLTSFSIDLKDYEEFEKKYLFEQFINFGNECNFLKIVENKKDIFTSSYAIINRRMKPKKLRENIISKMADQKIDNDPEIKNIIKKEKENTIKNVFYERDKKQKKITEFTD